MSGRSAVIREPLVSSTFDALASSRCVLVVTYRAGGEPVPTPVWPAVVDGRLYFLTDGRSGKLARIARDPRVAVARCTHAGRPTGPTYAGTARVVDGPAAEAVLLFVRRRRPALLGRLLEPPPDHLRIVEVTPARTRR